MVIEIFNEQVVWSKWLVEALANFHHTVLNLLNVFIIPYVTLGPDLKTMLVYHGINIVF